MLLFRLLFLGYSIPEKKMYSDKCWELCHHKMLNHMFPAFTLVTFMYSSLKHQNITQITHSTGLFLDSLYVSG